MKRAEPAARTGAERGPTDGGRTAGRTHRAWQPFLRGVTVLVALDGFAQAIFAGRFMQGSYDGLDAHSMNGMILAAGMLLMTACFAVAWRFGAAAGRTLVPCVLLTVCAGVEIALGHQQILAVHVPLGVALIAGLVIVTVQTWRNSGGEEQSAPWSDEPSESGQRAQTAHPEISTGPVATQARRPKAGTGEPSSARVDESSPSESGTWPEGGPAEHPDDRSTVRHR